MLDILKELCKIDGTSGNEEKVRDCIISKIDGFCEYKTDNLGNIIAFKKGKNHSKKRLMLDAHTDEVGLIITSVTSDGFLKFKTVGGIDTSALMFRRIKINGTINGVISGKPIHLLDKAQAKKLPDADSLYIDIGADSKEEALKYVSLGDTAVICGDPEISGNKLLSKAIDDRVGCAVLIKLLTSESDYDFYASFSVQEEVGLRGARASAFSVDPESAIVIEGTTAADIADVPEEKTVCRQGKGVAVSFMDNATLYDKAYYNAALSSGLLVQPKAAVSGGNNSGAIHLSREGVRTVSLSVPSRYIHTASSVADLRDIEALFKTVEYMLKGICSGEIS